MRSTLRLATRVTLIALLASHASESSAQNYPARPVRLIVPFPAGGGIDVVARIVAPKLAELLREQVVIDNRPGAAGNVGTEIAANAVPDGYTLLFVTASHAVNFSLYKKPRFHPTKDFSPVSLVASSAQVLLVHPSFQGVSPKALIALAKSKPGQLNYGSSGNGGISHLSMELLKSMAGIDLVHVPHKGSPQSMTEVMAGRVDAVFASLPTALPHTNAGRLKALGVTGATRSAVAPDIPAIAETLPGYEVAQWFAILAPAATPTEIITRLNVAVVKVMALPEVKDKLTASGADAMSSTPKEFADYLNAEILKWAAVIRQAAVRVD